ncbi:MAG: hypothetical protein OXT67_00790 [Zetaproteobacteria bacterium]|nr:hypothetical protein [Zetaproteobacteria bacterium]
MSYMVTQIPVWLFQWTTLLTTLVWGSPPLPQTLMCQLPEEIAEQIWLEVMQSAPQQAESLASTCASAQKVFARHALLINPYQYVLLPRKQVFFEQVVLAAHHNQVPLHLEELAQAEQQQWQLFLRQRERDLRTVEDWQRHAARLVSTWHSTWELYIDHARYVARDAALDARFFDSLSTSVYYVEDQAWWCAPEVAVQRALRQVTFDVVGYATCARHVDQELSSRGPLKQWLQAWVQTFPVDTDSGVMGRMVFRAAQTLFWLQLLDPQKQVLAQTYAQVELDRERSPGAWRAWFATPQHLHDKLEHFFGPHSLLAAPRADGHAEQPVSAAVLSQRQRCVAFYVQHLWRIQKKIELLMQQNKV